MKPVWIAFFFLTACPQSLFCFKCYLFLLVYYQENSNNRMMAGKLAKKTKALSPRNKRIELGHLSTVSLYQ